MKIIWQILIGIVFGCLGWILFADLFEWMPSFHLGSAFKFISSEPNELLYVRLFFSLILAIIPLLIGISQKFIHYKSRVYYFLGSPLLFVFGVFFATVRFYLIRPIRTIVPNTPDLVSFSELKINLYLFLGIVVGVLIFIGFGLLIKQVRFISRKS